MTLVEQSIEALKDNLADGIQSVEEFRGETTIVLEKDSLLPACELLRDDPELGFNFLIALSAVDYWPEEPRFALIYQLYSIDKKEFIGLRVPLHGEDPTIPTIESIYPNANWHEREVFDMFGVNFDGHSDLRRIIMPYDWVGHPLRKDYPLGYEEVQFSFNFDEIDGRKKYAKE
jgi:NADH-quinone oxidoreductase subunit C